MLCWKQDLHRAPHEGPSEKAGVPIREIISTQLIVLSFPCCEHHIKCVYIESTQYDYNGSLKPQRWSMARTTKHDALST
eukprot:6188057-Pleurochrysis_carterae.AAC.4